MEVLDRVGLVFGACFLVVAITWRLGDTMCWKVVAAVRLFHRQSVGGSLLGKRAINASTILRRTPERRAQSSCSSLLPPHWVAAEVWLWHAFTDR
jgi:hypothetical protein